MSFATARSDQSRSSRERDRDLAAEWPTRVEHRTHDSWQALIGRPSLHIGGTVRKTLYACNRRLAGNEFTLRSEVLDEDQLKALMIRSLRGDAAAYRQLLAILVGDLRSYFRNRIGLGADEIEDLVQETLLAIHTKRETYDAKQPLTAWLYAIARHKLVDRYRLEAKRATTPLDELHEPTSEREFETQMARRDVAIALQELPQKQADAIRCVKLEGLSVAETAIATGQSIPAVKVGIHRGLKKLLSRFARGEQ
jgi:RNA polymerase sigma-70 factor, ECF subfamily